GRADRALPPPARPAPPLPPRPGRRPRAASPGGPGGGVLFRRRVPAGGRSRSLRGRGRGHPGGPLGSPAGVRRERSRPGTARRAGPARAPEERPRADADRAGPRDGPFDRGAAAGSAGRAIDNRAGPLLAFFETHPAKASLRALRVRLTLPW